MTAIKGATAAVTGAASGIGRALALELAHRGCDLALADRDEAGLQAVPRSAAMPGARSRPTAPMSPSPKRSRTSRKPRPRPTPRSTFSSTMPASPWSANSARSTRRRWTGCSTSISGAWCIRPARSWAIFRANARRTLRTSPRSSASSRRRDRPLIARRNSRCAGFPNRCAMNCRWRIAPFGCRWCIPAGSPPTSRAIPARARASPTMRSARNRSSASARWPGPRLRPPPAASSKASRRTSRAF